MAADCHKVRAKYFQVDRMCINNYTLYLPYQLHFKNKYMQPVTVILGPQGCGKSTLADRLAKEFGRTFECVLTLNMEVLAHNLTGPNKAELLIVEDVSLATWNDIKQWVKSEYVYLRLPYQEKMTKYVRPVLIIVSNVLTEADIPKADHIKIINLNNSQNDHVNS